MFHYYNEILTIESSALYNKSMYDELLALDCKVKQSLEKEDSEAFKIYYRERQVLKELYKNDPKTFLTIYNYKAKLKRNHIEVVQKGGNGRMGLVSWDSLPMDLQQKIITSIGYDPKTETKKRRFKDYLNGDRKAEAFFKDFRKADGKALSLVQQKKYIARAQIYNAISDLIKERSKEKGYFGKTKTLLWKNLARIIGQLDSGLYPHKLPSHYRRLKSGYEKYVTRGYESILPESIGNDNSRKIKDDIAKWWLAMYCLPNKMVVPVIMNEYNRIRKDKDWPTLTQGAVNKWLEDPEVKRIWLLARHGKEEYDRHFKHHIKRKKAHWFPNAYWAIDGSKIDLMHYVDNTIKMGAHMKINPVIDVYSEKIIGWSISETENHVDHFNAIKMALNTSNCRPYLFTYDQQSGHKSSKMQALYTKVVAKKGGLHYPHKAYAHNSPSEQIFKRLQQQVINNFWNSDKQGVKVRTLDNRPNMDFITQNKHHLPSKENLIRMWEVCVKLWNEAPHPKYKDKSRNEVYSEAAPMKEEFGFLDRVDTFWIYNNRKSTYKKGGLLLTVGKTDFEYEVLTPAGEIDIEFRRKYVGAKFVVKYDPEYLLTYVQLYKEDENGVLTFVANAQPKREHETVPVLMKPGDKEAWKSDYNVRELEYERDKAALLKLQKETGITPEKLIEDQKLLIKMGGQLPKPLRSEVESQHHVLGF